MDLAFVLQTLSAQSVFSTRVFAVVTGSTTGKAPVLPSFSEDLCEAVVGKNDVCSAALVDLILTYAQVSVLF